MALQASPSWRGCKAVIGSKVHTVVLFLRPNGMQEGWARSDFWSRAAGIPGVAVVADADGREASGVKEMRRLAEQSAHLEAVALSNMTAA